MMKSKIIIEKATQKCIAIFIIAVIFLMDLAPLSYVWASHYNDRAAYPGGWHEFYSSSRRVLEIMASQLRYGNFVSKTKYNYYVPITKEENEIQVHQKNDGRYYISLPENYFDIYTTWSLGNDNINSEYNVSDRVDQFDFSNESLGDISLLPDFSKWSFNSDKVRVKFNNCNITDLSPLKTAVNAGYFDNVDIELEGNTVSLEDYNDFTELIKGHYIYIYEKPNIKTNPQTNIPITYIIKYDANGGTGAPSPQTKIQGVDLSLSKKEPTRTGYTFIGWSRIKNDDGICQYYAGDTFVKDMNVTLYAIWRKNGDNTPAVKEEDNTPPTTTITTTTTTTEYTWWGEMSFSGDSNLSDTNKYSTSKTITLKANVSGWIAENVPPSAGDCIMMVNGEYVTNNNGTGTYKVTKNGTYNVYIKYPTYAEEDAYTCTYTINTIDTEKPSYELTKSNPSIKSQASGTRGVILNITAKDNKALKSVKIGDKKYEVSGKQDTLTIPITESGNYTIIITDQAGNTYERTEAIEVDTETPEIVDCKVEKIGSTDNGNLEYIAAKTGDKIKITLKANEKIRSLGAATSGIITRQGSLKLNGVNYSGYGGSYIEVGSDTITFEIDIDKALEDIDSGWTTITVHGISDYANNYIDTYTVPVKLLIDTEAPEIKRVEITGGSRNSSQEAMFIQSGEILTFDIYMNEKLSTDPLIAIGNISTNATYYNEVELDGNTCYLYKVKVLCDLMFKAGFKGEGCIPVTIGNMIDYAGNEADKKTYDIQNPMDNGVYLYYGVFEIEDLYIVATENDSTIRPIGDLNGDGYITSYDLFLMETYFQSISNDSNDEFLEFGDMNLDGKLSTIDIFKLRNVINNTKNNIYSEKTFEVYDKNGKITGDDLNWVIYDKDGNDITENSEYVTTNYDSTNGTFTFNLIKGNEITIKVYRTTDKENENEIGTLKLCRGASFNAGIRVDSENRTGYSILGDVNNDGYITTYDAIAILRIAVHMDDGWDENALVRADINKDGNVTVEDAFLVYRLALLKVNVDENNKIDFKDSDNELFNVISKNDTITLYLVDTKLNETWSEIQWEVITLEGNDDAFSLAQADNGSCTITAQGDNGSRAMIKVTGKENQDSKEQIAYFYLEINDIDIQLNKYEVNVDLSQTQDNTKIVANVNMANKAITVKSNDENVAKIEAGDYGNVEVIPVGLGSTTIDFSCDGVTKSCIVNVIKSITEIDVNYTDVTLKEGFTQDIQIKTNEDTTESIEVKSQDESIAKIYYNEESGTYVIKAINPGETAVEVYSPSNHDIKKIINVTVEELVAPKLTNILFSDSNFKVGDTIKLKFTFDTPFVGDVAPDLLIRFGEYESVNKTEFVEFGDDNTSLTYTYTVADGDNGELMIEKLLGYGLTDDTTLLNVVKTAENGYYNCEYEYIGVDYGIEVDELEDSSEVEEYENGEYINDGIYTTLSAIADTTAPELRIETGDTGNWLTIGDNIEVKIISTNDRLMSAPKVYFNGIEATVEGSDTVFTATLEVTDEIEEGYLEITVDDYEDEAGNKGEKLVAKIENIDEPIIIDNTAPTAKVSVSLLTDKEDYKAGDKVKFALEFNDSTRNSIEYINAEEVPLLNLMFGNEEAHGKLTNDFISKKYDSDGEEYKNYVSQIIYTYEIAKEDVGDLTLQSITGKVEDVVGNEANLNMVYDDGGYYILSVDSESKTETKTYTVTYDANGGTNAPGAQKKTEGIDLTLSTTIPTRTGYKFLGWSTDRQATTAEYKVGAKYTKDANITLYAVWQVDTSNALYSGILPYTGAQIIQYIIIGIILFGSSACLYFYIKVKKK